MPMIGCVFVFILIYQYGIIALMSQVVAKVEYPTSRARGRHYTIHSSLGGNAMPKFEVFHSKTGYSWRLKASNGRIISVGDAYNTREHAKEACLAVRRAANDAEIVDADH
jgi:hypothetical protein